MGRGINNNSKINKLNATVFQLISCSICLFVTMYDFSNPISLVDQGLALYYQVMVGMSCIYVFVEALDYYLRAHRNYQLFDI